MVISDLLEWAAKKMSVDSIIFWFQWKLNNFVMMFYFHYINVHFSLYVKWMLFSVVQFLIYAVAG